MFRILSAKNKILRVVSALVTLLKEMTRSPGRIFLFADPFLPFRLPHSMEVPTARSNVRRGISHGVIRTYQSRGTIASKKGRRPNDTTATKKRKGEIVSVHLPAFKKLKKAHPHSISKAVAANRAAEKKH